MSTVTVVATAEPANVPPRVRLDVTDTGTPNLFAATVTRLNPDGRTQTVRTSDGNPLVLTTSGSNRVGLLYDYEMPYGASVTYSTIETPANTATATVDSSRVWLVHPGVPALSMPVTVASYGSRTRRVQQGIFYPMGRSTPVVQTDGARKKPAGALQLQVITLDELAKLEALTEDSGTLLLNIPSGLGYGIPTSYIAVGDMEEERLVDYAAEQRRYVTLPYQVVDRPVGGSQSQRTYVDVLASYSTYTQVQPAYPTYLALLSGP